MHSNPSSALSGSKAYPFCVNPHRRCFVSCALSFVVAFSAAAADRPGSTAGEKAISPAVSYFEALKQLPAKLRNDPVRLQQMQTILKEAERIRDLPLVGRASSLEELENRGGRRLGGIDKRTYAVQKVDAKKANIFAIASSDLENTAMIGRDLPLLAAAYVVTGESSYLDRIIAQLTETVQWEPLQRPGWELYTATHSLPPDGNDGVWLATGQGLAAICQTLAILPEGAIPADLMAKIRQQLKREVARITKDWTDKKMWFVKNNVPTTNQWIVPAAGQAMACSVLGKEADPVSYELAVANLLQSIQGLGDDGSTSEGTEYSQHWTAPFLYMAAQALGRAGDDRLISHGFFQNYPRWLALRYQPGQWMVNASDNWGGARGLYYRNASDFARLVSLTQNGELAWTLRNVIKVLPYDCYGLLSLTIPDEELKAPPQWALYERGRCAIWRSGWGENDSGVWVRGGDSRDGHDHYDRGHVNFIVDGKAVLIESGTPGYDDPRKREYFDSVAGHNVLQVGTNLYPAKVPALITVNKMDAAGGDLTVAAGVGYPEVERWTRHVTWNKRHLEVTDEVVLKEQNTLQFRWHLGTEQHPVISSPGNTSASAIIPDARITYAPKPDALEESSDWVPPEKTIMDTPKILFSAQADQNIQCVEERSLDHVFQFRNPNHRHTTLIVRSATPVKSMTIKTTVDVPEQTSP